MIRILNRYDEVVAVLVNDNGLKSCPYWDDLAHEKLNDSYGTFEFKAPADHEYSEFLVEENKIAVNDFDGDTRLFRIRIAEDIGEGEEKSRYIYGENEALELLGTIIRPQTFAGFTAQQSLDKILEGTRWERGNVDWSGVRSPKFENYVTAIEAIHTTRSMWGSDLKYRVTIDYNKISGRYVDLPDQVGADNGKRFEYGKDLEGIKRTVNSQNVYTAMYGVGKSNEDKTFATIAGAEWTKGGGDPADKPAGQEWIGDPEALKRWGADGKHIFGIYRNETIVDPKLLTQYTWKALQKAKEPLVTFEAKVKLLERLPGYGHEQTRIGDTVRILDNSYNPALLLQARVIEYKWSLSDPEQDAVVMGDYRPQLTSSYQVLKEIQSRLQVNQGAWDAIQKTYTGDEPPENPEPDTIWLDTSGDIDVYKRWDAASGQWIPASPQDVATFEEVQAAQQAAADAAAKADAAKSAADTAQTTATTAKGTADTAKTTADQAKTTAGQANTTAGQAKNTADAASTTAGQANTTAGQAKTAADTATQTATAAQGTANTANQTATTAKNTADTASQTATTAKNTADSAKTTADNAWGKFSGAGNTLPAGNVDFNFAGSTSKGGSANNTVNVGSQPATAVQNATLNFNSRNDRKNTTPASPGILSDGTAIDHTLNKDSSANISFEWTFNGSGDAYDIDGFIVFIRQQTASTAYAFGTTPAEEQVFYVTPEKRAFLLYGVPADQYYTFGIQAYRQVDNDINATGTLKSSIVKSSASGENPYRPTANIAFTGDVQGTIAGTAATTLKTDVNTAKNTAETAKSTADTAIVNASDAQSAANSAAQTATTAKNTADAASTTAGQANTTAGQANTTAGQAKSAADAASATAGQANTTAGQAKTAADAANTTAGQANTTAGQAKTAADTAASTATTAKNTADTAKTTADTAQGTATTAKNTADAAKTTADNAWGKFSGAGNTLPAGNVAFNFANSNSKGGNATNTDNVGTQPAATVQNVSINFNKRNDRISTTPANPTINSDGSAVDHTINKDSSANISFEWNFIGTGNAYDVDGFIIYVRQQAASTAYTFGSMAQDEQVFYVTPEKRAFLLYGVPADQYYTFGVQAYREVDQDINTTGFLKSAIVKSTATGENPYRPSASVAFDGELTGTINGKTPAEVTAQELNAKNAVQNGQVPLPAGSLSGDVNVDQNALKSITQNISFSRNGIIVTDPEGGTGRASMTASGFNAKKGSFTLEDEDSNEKYSLETKQNLLWDHSFEMLKPGNMITGATGYWDISQQSSSGQEDNYLRWWAVGSPKLMDVSQTDLPIMSPFGFKSVVVNPTNYIRQTVDVTPGRTFTASAHFFKPGSGTYFRRMGGGRIQLDFVIWQEATGTLKTIQTNQTALLKTPRADYINPHRLAITATAPVPTEAYDQYWARVTLIGSSSTSDAWVEVDGVQLVENDKPTQYIPENELYNFRNGLGRQYVPFFNAPSQDVVFNSLRTKSMYYMEGDGTTGEVCKMIGSSFAFQGFYPVGEFAGRKAWTGYGSSTLAFKTYSVHDIQFQPNNAGGIFSFDQVTNGGLNFGASKLKFLKTTATLQVRDVADANHVPIEASVFRVVSDPEVKTDIQPAESLALEKILETPIYSYQLESEFDNYEVVNETDKLEDENGNIEEIPIERVRKSKNRKKKEEVRRRTGILTTEAPAEVTEGNTVDLYAMLSLSWKAMQEMAAKNEQQDKRIKRKNKEIDEMAERLAKLETIVNSLQPPTQ